MKPEPYYSIPNTCAESALEMRLGERAFSVRAIGCTMIITPFRLIYRRCEWVRLRAQEREQPIQAGEVLRLVWALDRDQRRTHRCPCVIVPEPEQVGALRWFGHTLFRLLQPRNES